jgi:hypothetical protein
LYVDELLKIVADGNMFTYEEAEQVIETGMHEWYEGMPDLFGRTGVGHEETALVRGARTPGNRCRGGRNRC